MGISPVTVLFLRSEGHDVQHLAEIGLPTAPDAVVLERARREGRIVLTADLDFSALMAASGGRSPSVIVLRLRDMSPANVNSHLGRVLTKEAAAIGAGAIVSIAERRARVRLLPIDDAGRADATE
jgi:predicted nuclease of predicted toxin-antitoxin system